MDEILKDKLFCEDVIKKSYFNNKKFAEGVGAKYKEFAVKYHPDRKKNYQYHNPPYIKQLWHLAVGAKEVLHGSGSPNISANSSSAIFFAIDCVVLISCA
jgi:hypothetical protein